jgi:predicted ester cyclase
MRADRRGHPRQGTAPRTVPGHSAHEPHVEFDRSHIWRRQDDLIAEHWACMDKFTGLRQIGVALA